MVGPITRGARGPAVEDVQKRLLALGFDLGPTGVDGVFLGATLAAVRRFQRERDLAEDGAVGDETWAALVDATFQFGDRLLYLRLPHLHGADVTVLQGALNVLGFACGAPDGIFGPYTEGAVREFQANVGLPVDGIVGPDTVRAVTGLRHVWHGKDPASPAGLAISPARASDLLRVHTVALVARDECGRGVAVRVANLAQAGDPGSQVRVAEHGERIEAALTLEITCDPDTVAPAGSPVIVIPDEDSVTGRFVAAFPPGVRGRTAYVVVRRGLGEHERDAQSAAVRVLDGICAVLSQPGAAVLP